MPYKKLHKETIIVQTEIACYQAISVFFNLHKKVKMSFIKWWITLYSAIFEYADFFDIEERA